MQTDKYLPMLHVYKTIDLQEHQAKIDPIMIDVKCGLLSIGLLLILSTGHQSISTTIMKGVRSRLGEGGRNSTSTASYVSFSDKGEEVHQHRQRQEVSVRRKVESTSHKKNGTEIFNQSKWVANEQSGSICTDHGQLASSFYSTWNYSETLSTNIPGAIDYRDKDFVSSVDNQGSCQSCWAFAVAGSIEALMAKREGRLRKLSVQQLLDCSGPLNGCDGGEISEALRLVKLTGMMPDSDYVYEAKKKICRYNPYNVAFRISSYLCLKSLDEWELKYYIATIGPGIAIIDATRSLTEYRGGIFSPRTCSSESPPIHAILIVGYGYSASEGKDYWLIKNSMGPLWGESGYFRLERNKKLCGIGKYSSFWPGA